MFVLPPQPSKSDQIITLLQNQSRWRHTARTHTLSLLIGELLTPTKNNNGIIYIICIICRRTSENYGKVNFTDEKTGPSHKQVVRATVDRRSHMRMLRSHSTFPDAENLMRFPSFVGFQRRAPMGPEVPVPRNHLCLSDALYSSIVPELPPSAPKSEEFIHICGKEPLRIIWAAWDYLWIVWDCGWVVVRDFQFCRFSLIICWGGISFGKGGAGKFATWVWGDYGGVIFIEKERQWMYWTSSRSFAFFSECDPYSYIRFWMSGILSLSEKKFQSLGILRLLKFFWSGWFYLFSSICWISYSVCRYINSTTWTSMKFPTQLHIIIINSPSKKKGTARDTPTSTKFTLFPNLFPIFYYIHTQISTRDTPKYFY